MPVPEARPYRFEVFWEFSRFSFYTLREDGADQTLADASLSQLELVAESDHVLAQQLQRFTQLMRQIGLRAPNMRDPGMLRKEIEARALPPEAWKWHKLPYLQRLREEGFSLTLPSLRWYGYDADQRVLLLFEIGLKTHDDPTRCPNVVGLFRFAARASQYLDENRTDWVYQDLDLKLTDENQPLWL